MASSWQSGNLAEPRVIFEDNHLIAVVKAPGELSQGDATGQPSLLELTKAFLKAKHQKPGNVFLGLLHRLDRPVSGVLLFAKTSKAASRLSEQFRKRTIEKRYRALLSGPGRPQFGFWEDFWTQNSAGEPALCSGEQENTFVVRLNSHLVRSIGDMQLIEVDLETGKKHQIRLQCARRGLPVLNDRKYGGVTATAMGPAIGLESYSLAFDHPITKERMTIVLPDKESVLLAFLDKEKK